MAQIRYNEQILSLHTNFMDLQTFTQEVEALVAFPPDVRAYAVSVGSTLDDAGRDQLLLKLQPIHASTNALEQERVQNFETATQEIDALMHTELPAIRRAVEASEKDDEHGSLDALEQQIQS